MATLQIQNLPDEMYTQIQQVAAQHNQSISEQLFTLLSHALQTEKAKPNQAEILAEIEQRLHFRSADYDLPEPLTLLL